MSDDSENKFVWQEGDLVFLSPEEAAKLPPLQELDLQPWPEEEPPDTAALLSKKE